MKCKTEGCERELTENQVKHHAHVCTYCRYHLHGLKAAQTRYNKSTKGREMMRRRVYIGSNYYGYASTPEIAQKIKAHIKERINEFKQRQSAGTQAESSSPGTVQTQTEHPKD